MPFLGPYPNQAKFFVHTSGMTPTDDVLKAKKVLGTYSQGKMPKIGLKWQKKAQKMTQILTPLTLSSYSCQTPLGIGTKIAVLIPDYKHLLHRKWQVSRAKCTVVMAAQILSEKFTCLLNGKKTIFQKFLTGPKMLRLAPNFFWSSLLIHAIYL